MKQDIMCMLIVNFGLLPGELAVVTFGMAQCYNLNLVNFLCWVGVFLTINFVIGCAFSTHISEQRKLEYSKKG